MVNCPLMSKVKSKKQPHTAMIAHLVASHFKDNAKLLPQALRFTFIHSAAVALVVACVGCLQEASALSSCPFNAHPLSPRHFYNARQRLRSSLQPPRLRVLSVSNEWNDDDEEATTSLVQNQAVHNYLVCGDGDLSFSASIASDLANQEIALLATVLEDQQTHHQVYKDSQDNLQHILSFENHKVRFGVDATNLKSSLTTTEKFGRIQFNFPHWKGKANHKRNRELLSNFFQSATQVLSRRNGGGEVHVALCEGQGGVTAKTSEEYRQSWKVAQLAAEHGLLLTSVEPFQPKHYNLSSHRGVDRPFPVGVRPELYVFQFPPNRKNDDNNIPPPRVDQTLQLCCRHELHILLDEGGEFSREDLVQGNVIPNLIEKVVPKGIRVEVPVRRTLQLDNTQKYDKATIGSSQTSTTTTNSVVYLVVYCGEQTPLTRTLADAIRSDVENEVSKHVPLREDRKGRLVSRPFHYPVLKPDELRWFAQQDG